MGCWGSSPTPGASAMNRATDGPSHARPRAGGPAHVGDASGPRSPHYSPHPGRRGLEEPQPESGARALTHRRRGEEQPASPPAPSLELKRRLLSLRPPRPVHPPRPPASRPSPRYSSAAAAAAAAATAASLLRGSANRLEEGRARAPAATAHNLRPRPAAGARTPQGAGTGSEGAAPPPARPPTHAVAWQLS